MIYISTENTTPDERQTLNALLRACMLPEGQYVCTDEPAESHTLRAMCQRILLGQPLAFSAISAAVQPGKKDAALLRKALSFRQSLRLIWPVLPVPVFTEGGAALGKLLYIPLPDADGCVSMPLPEGTWTELISGETFTKCYRRVCPMGHLPVLVAGNTLLPVLPDDCSPDREQITLHWFQPDQTAFFTTVSGESYTAAQTPDGYHVTPPGIHLVVRWAGNEILC